MEFINTPQHSCGEKRLTFLFGWPLAKSGTVPRPNGAGRPKFVATHSVPSHL
jgi:hypothetical protein